MTKPGMIVICTVLILAFVILQTTAAVIDFDATPKNGESPLEVKFTDTSDQAWVDSWQWDFGDGSTSSLQSPEHTYSTPGWYTVTLRASNVSGEWPKKVKEDYINVQHSVDILPPYIDLTSGEAPLKVQFSANASVDGRNPEDSDPFIAGWNWTFGDNDEFGNPIVGTGKKTEHVYQKPGIYPVTVHCKLFDGINKTYNGPSISVGPDILPSFYWEYLTSDPTCCYLVKFTDTTLLQTGKPDSWEWNFGDGANSTEKNPTHRFKEVGNYTVYLNVTQSKNSENITHTIPIIEGYRSPAVIITPTPTPEELSARFMHEVIPDTLTVQFKDVSLGYGINQWKWTFGDRSVVSTLKDPLHTYSREGEYQVQLEVQNKTLNTNSTRRWIKVDIN